MLSRAEPADHDLLARHLAKRISLHEGDPLDVLSPLKVQLPEPYHVTLQTLEQHARQHQSLATALAEQPHSSLRQLGVLLQQTSRPQLPTALNNWLQQRARLQRIGVLVEHGVGNQLVYFLALLTVFSCISLTWLMFVAPTYNALFSTLSGEGHGPSFTQLLLTLAGSDHPLTIVLKALIALLPVLAALLLWLVKQQVKRLRKGQALLRPLQRWPMFKRFTAIQALFSASPGVMSSDMPDESIVQPLLNADERLEWQLASQGNYLPTQVDELRALPETVLANRVAAPLQRLTKTLTILLWMLIAGFLVAAYQPIFSLGASI